MFVMHIAGTSVAGVVALGNAETSADWFANWLLPFSSDDLSGKVIQSRCSILLSRV